jgi:3-oxoacyl-[acyl-carrier protein] reductase
MYKLFMTNLGGAMEVNRRFIPRMQADGYGRVIHVCSIASGEAVGSVGYNTVKAALGAYVRSLGRELAPYGVVVSGIAPGGFQAPGNAMERLKERSPEAYEDFLKSRLPRGYMGKAEELLPLLKYLASPEASMMGGCLVPIDAGEARYYP